MDMVFNAAYPVAFRAFVADELRHVGVKAFSGAWIKQWFAVFCAENDMHEID